jgi:peptidoglycan/xylan/chitin deacetylase (PgdA/CDA1 family)
MNKNDSLMRQGQRMSQEHGIFTVSLDFELYWGVRDKRSIEDYQANLRGVRTAVPKMLHLFRDNDIHATWATVGFLFLKDSDDMKNHAPNLLPSYNAKELSPYIYSREAPSLEPAYHFAPDVIELISKHEGQEIGTHTFSHYYCLENGQSLAQFEEDISSAIRIANDRGISIKSLVFPRNQWNSEYLPSLTKHDVQCYRGNEPSWMHKASKNAQQKKLQRACRLIDAYLNLSGHNTYNLTDCIQTKPFNFPASRFLRPYSKKLAFLDKIRLKRIKKSMDYAAINNRIFHLWWHPHNFGINTDRNIEFLAGIIEHYKSLRKNHGMVSLNMAELCPKAASCLPTGTLP